VTKTHFNCNNYTLCILHSTLIRFLPEWRARSLFTGIYIASPLLLLTFLGDTDLSREHCCITLNNFTFLTVAQQHSQRTLLRFYRYNV
jgi:hypothetical protein